MAETRAPAPPSNDGSASGGGDSAGGRCPEVVRSDGLAKERLAEGARFVMGVRKGDGECEALAQGEGFEGEVADGAAVVAAG